MNHRVYAYSLGLPACPECSCGLGEACLDDKGRPREPHRIRLRVRAGEVFVLNADDARARRQLRAIRELAATLPRRSR